MQDDVVGKIMHDLCKRLFPIARSITGDGFRESLKILSEIIPLNIHEVASGTRAFDWMVPQEWNISDAYIIDPSGQKICNFKDSNLHVLGYSTPIDKAISLKELQSHLYSLDDQPNAIPYVTSYYKERWGFCITQNERDKLVDGDYQVFIDSELKDGSLTYGELLIPGETEEEIFLSTYLCHPSMANNELSGPAVATYLGKWLLNIPSRKYSYRIIFIPETIGSLVYLSRNLDSMKQKIIAGYNISCIGDDRAYSYLPSRSGNTLADVVALHVLKMMHPDFVSYSFLDRGSDERQYCSPGIDLPVCSVMRTKYGKYPEYHTSLDDLNLVTPEGLLGGFKVLKRSIECLEMNKTYKLTTLGEPQLGKRGLYPTISTKKSGALVRDMMNFMAYCDGEKNAIEIAEIIDVPLWTLKEKIDELTQAGLLIEQ
jgi:aminopeptidase-like protein